MRTRAITALFFVIVMVASMLLGSYVFTVFFILLSTYCVAEFYRIIGDDKGQPNRPMGLLLGIMGFGLFAGYRLLGFDARYLLVLAPFVAAVFIIPLYQKHGRPFGGIAYTLLGVVYVVLPFIAFFSLGFVTGAFDYRLPLGFMLILWGNDTGAYLAGKFLGKRRLFERISPNKTWEGFVGGVLLALVTALVIGHYFAILVSWQWAGMALVISLFGTFGDLVESMLKRSQQVKDSGAVLPGHGGLLDRFDGLLFAAPAALVFLELVY
ncbi:phosphatidate cytidylyltransferase [Parapedobacter sp. 10938]|uniref:phosphatidate cytidylyltransferase n=1 Tax=Parapedobacter flavus TaxID=3110225 RepID=UPI002DBFDB69|nr:phosphatidate cytidylyltransferase [Parapedobacter sp. 10938]MEC3879968.1 phosphatidate cytidylyltransferase [Parapedobacter sp. 10938]